MGDITRQTIIDAPQASVFEYVSDPWNAPEFISSITNILSGPRGALTEGQVWRAQANFLGRQNSIALRLDELQRPQFVRFAIQGEPKASLSLRLSGDGSGERTRVWLLLEVPNVPSILLNGLMGGLLEADVGRLRRKFEGER